MSTEPGEKPHKVVIVGGGFGGLKAARKLGRAPVEVTLVDRRNFHLFQPLLYQVATGGLSTGEIATPLRGVLKRQRNTRVVMGDVAGFDVERRRVLLDALPNGAHSAELPYDTLIVSAGASHAYFGHDEWARHAPGLKTIEDALRIRHRILLAFEAAEVEEDEARRRAFLTFVVVGAGPTGVELAGQIGEIARETLRRDFRSIDPAETEVLLVEAADRVLTAYTPKLSAKAAGSLERLGVTPRVNTMVVGIDAESVTMKTGDADPVAVPARTVIWAAGVQASPLARALGEATGAAVDRVGRVTVEPDLTLPGHPEIFALGDMVSISDGAGGVQRVPGVAQVAIQGGEYAAKALRARLAGNEVGPFNYRDKGNLATIGRKVAVADIKGIRFGGFPAWVTWLTIHLLFLVGVQNRLIVLLRWSLSFLTRGRAQRLITGESTDSA